MTAFARFRSLVKRLRTPRPQGVILLYHRVASGLADPWRLCVSPEHFAEQLDVVASSWQPLALHDLAREEGTRSGSLPVAITFDDGYADNLQVAAPLLAERGLPASFFIVSGTIGSGREFWWDELEGLLLRREALPPELTMPRPDGQQVFRAGAAAAALTDPATECARILPWEAPADSRVGFYYAVWRTLQGLDDEARRRAIDALRVQLELRDEPRASHRIMTTPELQQLAAAPRVEIGAHSVTHAALSVHRAEQQLDEMRDSKGALERTIGRTVRAFAYPYGDLGPATARLAASAGFDLACTTEEGCVTARSDPFQLPRISVGDWDGPTFARRLADFVR
jgi:peptidoglycan/xylan/chitin deacetylase (PgdA/CDA1 family)